MKYRYTTYVGLPIDSIIKLNNCERFISKFNKLDYEKIKTNNYGILYAFKIGTNEYHEKIYDLSFINRMCRKLNEEEEILLNEIIQELRNEGISTYFNPINFTFEALDV